MAVYVMTHKYFEYPLPDGYMPMLLGTENGKKYLKGILGMIKGIIFQERMLLFVN